MLEYESMFRRKTLLTSRIGLTCLLLLPSVGAIAGTLREKAVSYRTKGYEQQRQGDYAGAATWYRKAIALDPAYVTPHNDLGVVLEEQGRLDEAERIYQQALSINPHYLEAHGNLAMLYERTGQKEKAIFHWLKRYQLGDPSDLWTARAEERLVALGALKAHLGGGGKPYARRRAIEEALERYQKSSEEFLAVTEQHGAWP